MTIIIYMRPSLLINQISKRILGLPSINPIKVAIDGVDASGKTFLADEIAANLRSGSRQVIQASADGFHNPRSIRYKKGSLSPEGFYYDSYNYKALIKDLLDPLSHNGDRQYRTKAFDVVNDQPVDSPSLIADDDAILIMDGIFLLRPEMLPFWDLTIYLVIDFANSMPRGIARDAELIGSHTEAERRYRERYVPGQRLYHRVANPLDKADILIDNNNLEDPHFLRVPVG